MHRFTNRYRTRRPPGYYLPVAMASPPLSIRCLPRKGCHQLDQDYRFLRSPNPASNLSAVCHILFIWFESNDRFHTLTHTHARNGDEGVVMFTTAHHRSLVSLPVVERSIDVDLRSTLSWCCSIDFYV